MMRSEPVEPAAVLLRQTLVLLVVTVVLASVSRALDGSFVGGLDSGTFVAVVLPLILLQVVLAVVPVTAVLRSWSWGRWPQRLHPAWPLLGVLVGSALFMCAYLPTISEVAHGLSAAPTDIRSPLRALVVPGFLLAAFSAINITPRRWREIDLGVERRRRQRTESEHDEMAPLILLQFGVMVAAIVPYFFVVDLASDGQLGATNWITFVLIGAVASVLAGGLGAFVVGLPLRLLPPARRWWFRHAPVFPAIAAVGFGVLAVSLLPGFSRGEMGEEPYVWLWLPATSLPEVGFALVSFGALHTIPPRLRRRTGAADAINWTASSK